MSTPPPWSDNAPKFWSYVARRFLFGVGAAALAVVAFYLLENWRGHRAWENCRNTLAAKGESLDWETFVPAPLPDESNALKAPMMKQWFGSVLTTNGFNAADSPVVPLRTQPDAPLPLAQIEILPPAAATNIMPGDADIVLRFVSPGLAFFLPGNSSALTNDEIVPLVSLNQVPPVRRHPSDGAANRADGRHLRTVG
jgi:hypothetical protein